MIELMERENHYSRPPVTEAILDFQVELPAETFVSHLGRCQDSIRSDYPSARRLKEATGQLELGPTAATTASSREVGHAFASADGKQVFQARITGFTVNRLEPYTGWKAFRNEAWRLWSIYREVARPTKITRVALRFINRLDIPFPVVELKDYLRTSPELSPDLPQSMARFFMNIAVPLTDIKTTANLTETFVDPPQPGIVSVVLDLDLYRTEQLPSSEVELWNLIDVLRAKKNSIFEACITDKTRELIR